MMIVCAYFDGFKCHTIDNNRNVMNIQKTDHWEF